MRLLRQISISQLVTEFRNGSRRERTGRGSGLGYIVRVSVAVKEYLLELYQDAPRQLLFLSRFR